MRFFETLQYAKDHCKNPTPAGSLVWEKLRNRKFYGLKLNRQYLIEYKQIFENKLYDIADFHNFEHKLIFEIDGPIHLEQQEYDQERKADLEAIGYKVIRFTNDDVLKDWDRVESKLLSFFPYICLNISSDELSESLNKLLNEYYCTNKKIFDFPCNYRLHKVLLFFI